MIIILLLIVIFTFLITSYLIKKWIPKALKAGLVGSDMHKLNHPLIAEVGGLPVISGFMIGTLLFLAIMGLIYKEFNDPLPILTVLISLLLGTIIGLVDDILGWKIGLRIRYKILLTFWMALPAMIINAGVTSMYFPIYGLVQLGIIYTLIIIPIGVMGASNSFNMLAGYNGLEAGQGIIILFTLAYFCFKVNQAYLGAIAIFMIGALLAFLRYNYYPAIIFPGNILTYSIGCLSALIAIFANIEKFAVLLFSLYAIEFFLKLRGGMQKESYGQVLSNETLVKPYENYYGLEHIIIDILVKIKKRVTEKEVVWCIWGLQTIVAVIDIIYFNL